MDVKEVLADLLAEQAALDAVMVTLADEQWALDTPSPRWSVADQIGHLTYFDNTAAMAISDPDAFTASLAADYRGNDRRSPKRPTTICSASTARCRRPSSSQRGEPTDRCWLQPPRV